MFFWDETQADLSSNVFATCIRKTLLSVIESDPGILRITLWSDGCGYQNRNQLLSNMLLDFSISNQVIVEQKFLEKGHTQMEVDSVHANVEKRLKNRIVYWPNDYVNVLKECRPTQPFEVIEMNYNDVLDFSSVSYVQSIRPGKKAGEPQVHNLRAIKYLPQGEIHFKTNHVDDYKPLPQRVKLGANPYEMTKLFATCLQIKKTKFQHLQQLKSVMPPVYHDFYNSLPFC